MESVWDYPRPPRLEPTSRRLRVEHAGLVVAESVRAQRVLETSHPPTYYLPPEDVDFGVLRPSGGGGSWCEWKGLATYWDVVVPGADPVRRAAWSYPRPTPGFAALRDHLAFYASRLDACSVDGEPVARQEGDFYGGWITADIAGPFKGAPGTLGW